MSTGHVTLTYRDLDAAMRFAEQGDHDDETVAVDHPEFYCTRREDGVWRAPLPRLSAREFVSAFDVEDALIAAIDGIGEEDEPEEIDVAARSVQTHRSGRRMVRPQPTPQAQSSERPITASPSTIGSRKAVTAEWGGLLRSRDKYWLKDNNNWKETSAASAQHRRHSQH